jgi:hypothetical protein
MSFEAVYGDSFTTGVVRGNHVWLHAKDTKGKFPTMKHCMTLLTSKTDKETIQSYKSAICEVCNVSSIKDDYVTKHPLIDDDNNLRDGDSEDMKDVEGYAGHVYFKVTTDQPFECFVMNEDGEIREVKDPEEIKKEFYAGAYYQVILKPCQHREGEVTFYLEGVLKVKDGKRLSGGGVDTKQMFMASAAGKNGAGKVAKAKSKAPVDDEDEDETDDEEEEVAPKKKLKTKPAKAPAEDEEDEDEEEDEPVVKKSKKKVAPVEADEDEEEDEDEIPTRPAKKKAKVVEPDEDEEDEEEEAPKKKKKAKSSGLSSILD